MVNMKVFVSVDHLVVVMVFLSELSMGYDLVLDLVIAKVSMKASWMVHYLVHGWEYHLVCVLVYKMES